MSLRNPLVVYVESSTKSTVDTGIRHAMFRGPIFDPPECRMRIQRKTSLEHCLLYAMHLIQAANLPRKLPFHGTHRPLLRFDCLIVADASRLEFRLTDERFTNFGLTFASPPTGIFQLDFAPAPWPMKRTRRDERRN